ncbi:transporter substrate-binding domain-containing protein [Bdellovibrio reynosensis]|uniref:Transporter substrate-binding domain-containing protein n=1 Tax=Bdellovibrio reynosensis TaxID=2835041 RepID=A0ABY4CCS9_9BACT|nr:transporter substrate-binding domain-containing protein [Bdellovibrio reynosensis]UOF01333.1 transporter substrate-binding domain-containing protein [Bdellovibrio reynosensis]
MAQFSLVLVIIFSIATDFAFAQRKKKEGCERRYIVDMTDFAPIVIRTKGKLTGIAPDLISALRSKTGCIFIESEFSLPEIADKLVRGKSDIVLLAAKKSDIAATNFFVPLYTNTREIVVAKSVFVPNKTINDYIDDPRIKFAHLIGAWSTLDHEKETKLIKANRMIGIPGPEEAFGLLKEKRVQALLFTGIVNSYFIKKLEMENHSARVYDRTDKVEVGAILSTRRMNDDERRYMKLILDEIKADGTLLKILTKYVSYEDAKSRLK